MNNPNTHRLELSKSAVISAAITCDCGRMIESLAPLGLGAYAYDEGWRFLDDCPTCPICVKEWTNSNVGIPKAQK